MTAVKLALEASDLAKQAALSAVSGVVTGNSLCAMMNGQQHTWDDTLLAVDSLISGKKRSDGRNWSHAFDMMDLFLEVRRCCGLVTRVMANPNGASVHHAVQRAGLKDRLKTLSVIHVAGTKGKVMISSGLGCTYI